MTLSEKCATRFVPLMARIVLCAAFLPVGWHKLFTTTTFTHDESNQLASLGVGDSGLDWSRVKATGPGWRQSEESTKVPLPTHASTLSGRSLYQVALISDNGGMPYPAAAAWLVALTELGAGLLLGLGFCARIAGLLIAAVMGAAFWMTSRLAIAQFGFMSLPLNEYLQFSTQTGLFALSFGVFLVGPGWLSLDGFLGTSGGGKKSAADKPSKTSGRSKDAN